MTKSKNAMDELDNADRARMLSIIDQFRAFGISKDISLPQLVVVGDQSSGKSSLLEGLTGLTFPTSNQLCTRFATQIILRRSTVPQAKVSIIPGPSSSADPAQKAALLSFSPDIKGDKLAGSRLAEILDQAAIAMGLPSASQKDVENLSKRFSDDVLSIELSGPEHQHLSVVDVPGLFHNPTPAQTMEDLATIRELIGTYMRNKRTIMLAVMDALNNLANQEVFSMAKGADPEGRRTVGIITKCDAVSKGDELPVIAVAQNQIEKLYHGWFAVRNRSTMDIENGMTIPMRHVKEEEFFKQAPWSTLPKERVGISSMRSFLAQLLYDHIRGEFPQLVEEIRGRVIDCRAQIQQLGEPRETNVQQRAYLTGLANRYQNHNSEVLKGNYNSRWKPKDPRKLRMHIAVENDRFTSRMNAKGHTYAFKKVDETIPELSSARSSANGLDDTLDVMSRYKDDGDDKFGDIYSWIRDRYRKSRGAELPGTVNPTVLENLFRQQSESWEKIANDYITVVDGLVHHHNDLSFREIYRDETIRRSISERNKRAAFVTREAAASQLNKIMEDEMNGILQTTNHYFADNLASNKQERVMLRLQKFFGEDNVTEDGKVTGTGYKLTDIMKVANMSNEDSAIFDIHDIIKAYYTVAIKRFIDNVIVQVTERFYLGPEGPLRSISPGYVGGLADDELRGIAGESRKTVLDRDRLSTQLAQLEQALQLGEAEQ